MEFNQHNVNCLPNFFDDEISSKIYIELEQLEFDFVKQIRHGHYGHVFQSEDPNLPDHTESYAANFYSAKNREGSTSFNLQFVNKVVPFLKSHFPTLRYFLKPNIVKITEGCYYRSHSDAYAGQVGYNFFFSSGWKWDYGGILTFVNSTNAFPIFPANNLAVIRNEEARPQHYMDPVTPWSKHKYYYLLLGWASSEDQGDSELRGSYYNFE